MSSVLALIDCNNFFVSCERLFRPDLEGRPVVVLSSNDGCAVSRSAEAKALGIPMGAPAFKYRDLFRRHGVVAFSANFNLYGDISQRITGLLTRVTPHIEVYSVDESFLDLSELGIANYDQWGGWLRERILREVGIPVSVGIAPSKTLAKLCNHRAKKMPELHGSLAITDPTDLRKQRFYMETPVEDIWGVGRRLAPRLKAEGVHNAMDLRQLRARHARQLMGIHGARMVAELNGTCCLPLEEGEEQIHQTVIRGRTLGQEVYQLEPLEAAVASLASRAAFCVRKERLLVKTAYLLLNTNKHKPGYRRFGKAVRFAMPTNDTGLICGQLVAALKQIHRSGTGIYRVSVLFPELVPAGALKLDLFGEVNPAAHDRSQARMAAFDAINSRFGKGHVRYAAEALSDAWQPRKGARSPRYTTSWTELPKACL
jgi:DNA polymerase V